MSSMSSLLLGSLGIDPEQLIAQATSLVEAANRIAASQAAILARLDAIDRRLAASDPVPNDNGIVIYSAPVPNVISIDGGRA